MNVEANHRDLDNTLIIVRGNSLFLQRVWNRRTKLYGWDLPSTNHIVVYLCFIFYCMQHIFGILGWRHACICKIESLSFGTGILLGGWRRWVQKRKVTKERNVKIFFIKNVSCSQIDNTQCKGFWNMDLNHWANKSTLNNNKKIPVPND